MGAVEIPNWGQIVKEPRFSAALKRLEMNRGFSPCPQAREKTTTGPKGRQ